MNIYFKELPFTPVLRLIGAKRSAFWCKTQCVLVLNGVRFDAKRSPF